MVFLFLVKYIGSGTLNKEKSLLNIMLLELDSSMFYLVQGNELQKKLIAS